MKSVKKAITYLLFTLIFAGYVQSQEKITITKAEDLPRHTYEIRTTAVDLFTSEDQLADLMNQVKKNILTDLETYDIQDKTSLKEYYGVLLDIYLLNGEFDKALDMSDKIKQLQEKPASKYISGLSTRNIVKAKQQSSDEQSFIANFEKHYQEAVNKLPWNVVEDEIKSMKGAMDILSENLLVGIIQSSIEPAVEKNNHLSFDLASQIINFRIIVDEILVIKESINKILTDYIEKNTVIKPDIWQDRSVVLSKKEKLHKTRIAIWDSGVDEAIFTEVLHTNKNEKKDGQDTDKDGYIDNVHGIAYNVDNEKTQGLLFPLSKEQQERMPASTELVKGLSDMQAAIDSKEATKLKKKLSELNPEDVEPFFEEISLFGNYAHGTHVAGIAAAGNPFVEIVPVRMTFEYKMIPSEPTIEKAITEATMFTEVVDFCKANNIKVVNMSWGGNMRSIEYALEANGVGENGEERKKLAANIFKIGRDSLYNAIKNAPGILFVTSGGNSDNDAAFEETIPSSFNLPNIISVGAVDQAGDETGFTSFGETVKIYANGFEVDSYIPGGKTMKMSGTSMSSPNVVNLAAKMLAYKPDLTPTQIIDLIIENADKTETGRVLLIHPKNTIEAVKKL